MARKRINYTVYKITSPTGKSYIGATKSTIQSRWKQHLRSAKKHPHRELYRDVARYGVETFKLEALESNLGPEECRERERYYIEYYGIENLYNYTKGGEEGNINGFKEVNAIWRKENPKDAWKRTNRAMRCAVKKNTVSGVSKAKREDLLNRPLKERLLKKHKGVYVRSSEATKKIWEARSEKDKEDIFSKISDSQKLRYAENAEVKEANTKQVAKARESIDREKQGKAASSGLKKYWADLRADPEKYAAHMELKSRVAKEAFLKLKAEGEARGK